MLLAIILTSATGLILGLLGTGGSMLVVPILVYVAGLPAREAVGLSLLIVGSTALLGFLLNLRRGAVNLPVGSLFAIAGILGAPVGARLGHLVSTRTLLASFSVLMIVVGIRMVALKPKPAEPRSLKPDLCVMIGFMVGLLTGFFGVGGGFLIVPGLVLFGGLEMKSAVASSLGVIALNCFAGLAGHLGFFDLSPALMLMFVLAASLGMLAGLALAGSIASDSLQRTFAVGLLLLGTVLLVHQVTSGS